MAECIWKYFPQENMLKSTLPQVMADTMDGCSVLNTALRDFGESNTFYGIKKPS